jgi:hypothetical protein
MAGSVGAFLGQAVEQRIHQLFAQVLAPLGVGQVGAVDVRAVLGAASGFASA